MKILHMCLSCFYIDKALYQENELVREHVALGHDVRVIASTEVMAKDGQLTYTEPGEYMGSDGAMVKRLPYRKLLPHKIMRKLRLYSGVEAELENFAPDLIIFHGACAWDLLTVSDYAARNPNVRLRIDSHEDANNSGRNALSRELLHRRYFGPILRRALPPRDSILCISLEVMDFVHELYDIPRDRLEFFPLGGRPLSDTDYEARRTSKRAELGLRNDEVMLFQSGKFDRLKRLDTTLRAFVATPDPKLRLFLSGVVMKDERAGEIDRLIASDSRITFLGWSNSDEMTSLLAAADVYIQPGSQSVSMQNSMCQRCAIVIDDVKSHQPFVDGNGYLTKAGTDLAVILRDLSDNKGKIAAMQQRSHALALDMLDYAMLSKRLTGSEDNADPVPGT